MTDLNFRIEAGFSYSSSGPPGDRTTFHVRVYDPLSSLMILEFELDKTQFIDFMSNSGSTEAAGSVISPTGFGRVGKKLVVDGENFGRMTTEEELEQAKARWSAAGWESISTRKTNSGFHLTARKWVDPE